MAEAELPEREHRLHPALSDSHELDFSVDKTLFDSVLTDERFEEWQSSSNKWQLRFTGSPGCGKTTLSSIIVERLREKYTVASIYLQQDVLSYEAIFVEDFLWTIFIQLSKYAPSSNSGGSYKVLYGKYIEACRLQQRGAYRMKLIRSALHALVSTLQETVFLVVDDIDRCSRATLIFAEEEMSTLQGQGVKIMTTSRIPWFDEPWRSTTCDGKECFSTKSRSFIHLYWACDDCVKNPDEAAGITAFCKDCWPTKAICTRCKNTTRFKQPYEHVDFNISHTAPELMFSFIKRALRQEHGDIGLGDATCEDKAFTSDLGRSLRRYDMAEDVVNTIFRLGGQNIALTHKRLELFHCAKSVNSFFTTRDRLPAAIVEIFDRSLEQIEAQAANERILGLQAIALVGRDANGISFEEFKDLTRLNSLNNGNSHQKFISYRSLDDVLHAAKGFVVRENRIVRHPPWQVPILKAFHPDFYLYSCEHYNPAIVWANNSVQQPLHGKGGLKRAQTFAPSNTKGGGVNNGLSTRVERAANHVQRSKIWVPESSTHLGGKGQSGAELVESPAFNITRRTTFQAP